jgi:hypothetical protein
VAQKKCERDDRFSERNTHVSPTALNLAQNAPRSEPISKNEQSTDKARVNDEKHTKAIFKRTPFQL